MKKSNFISLKKIPKKSCFKPKDSFSNNHNQNYIFPNPINVSPLNKTQEDQYNESHTKEKKSLTPFKNSNHKYQKNVSINSKDLPIHKQKCISCLTSFNIEEKINSESLKSAIMRKLTTVNLSVKTFSKYKHFYFTKNDLDLKKNKNLSASLEMEKKFYIKRDQIYNKIESENKSSTSNFEIKKCLGGNNKKKYNSSYYRKKFYNMNNKNKAQLKGRNKNCYVNTDKKNNIGNISIDNILNRNTIEGRKRSFFCKTNIDLSLVSNNNNSYNSSASNITLISSNNSKIKNKYLNKGRKSYKLKTYNEGLQYLTKSIREEKSSSQNLSLPKITNPSFILLKNSKTLKNPPNINSSFNNKNLNFKSRNLPKQIQNKSKNLKIKKKILNINDINKNHISLSEMEFIVKNNLDCIKDIYKKRAKEDSVKFGEAMEKACFNCQPYEPIDDRIARINRNKQVFVNKANLNRIIEVNNAFRNGYEADIEDQKNTKELKEYNLEHVKLFHRVLDVTLPRFAKSKDFLNKTLYKYHQFQGKYFGVPV